MEKTELTVSIEPERLAALQFFMLSKAKTTPQKELDHALEEMYEKYVPADTREYLDSKRKPVPARPRPKRPAKPEPQQPVGPVSEAAPFRPVPPRVRFCDRTGAGTPPHGAWPFWGVIFGNRTGDEIIAG
jgi:hypothetical protein